MNIKKLGHCCLLIKTKGITILTDPGSYTIDEHSKLEGIDFIFYTHEHADHYHLESLQALMAKNPKVKIYANTSVSGLLTKVGIEHSVAKFGDTLILSGEDASKGVQVKAIGDHHASMHSSVEASTNTGYFFDERLWYPGDSWTDPRVYIDGQIEILALPVAGPWMKIGEAIDYALLIKPKVCFPVHDGTRWGSSHSFPEKILNTQGIKWELMMEGDEKEF